MDKGPSLILALNARYETAWQEYHRLEAETIRLGPVHGHGDDRLQLMDLQTASIVNQREVDALRLAILYQLPVSWQEALVLACHVHTAFAITDSFDTDHKDPERQAFEVGLDTLLEFIFGEVDHQDIEAGQMKHLEAIVRSKRQSRVCKEPSK